MHALVVVAHPDPASLSQAVAQKLAEGVSDAGHSAEIADLAEEYAFDEIRISHEQNVILPHIHKGDLPAVHAALVQGLGAGLGLRQRRLAALAGTKLSCHVDGLKVAAAHE